MKVEVIAQLDELRMEDILNKTVIVIDVLRSSSTIVTALAIGYREVYTTETIGQARNLESEDYFLAGERYGKKIQGFTFSNSPCEIQEAPVTRPGLILTSTNGTRAIQKAKKGSHVLIGCFLNGKACAEKAMETGKDIAILCAGSRHCFALEDGLAGGYIITELRKKWGSLCMNDLGLAMEACYHYYQSRIYELIKMTATGKRLSHMGLEHEIEYCAQLNLYPIVPVVHNERIIASCP